MAVAPVFSPEARVTSLSNQNVPDVGVAGTGNYAGTFDVVYQQANGGGADVVVKRFNADGTPLAANLGANTITVDTSNVPMPGQRIAVRADGSFVVVYRQSSGVANIETIAAKVYNADGTVRATVPNLVTTGYQSSDMQLPAVAVQDFTGNITVVWAKVNSATDSDIYLRRLDLSGNFLTPGDVAVAATADQETEPAVDSVPNPLPAGQIDTVVTFADMTQSGTVGPRILYVRYDGSGNRLDNSTVQVNATTNAVTVAQPSVGFDAAGEFVIAWVDGTGTSANVLMRRFDRNGAVQSPANMNEVVDNTAGTKKSLPRVARADDGRYVVAFAEDLAGGNGTRVAFRQFAKDGSPVAAKRTLSNSATTVGGNPAAAASGTGIFAVAGDENQGGGFDTFARTFQEQAPQFFAYGGGGNQVVLYRVSDGSLYGSPISPFASYNGGVAVAFGDVNGDGIPDLVVAATTGNPAIKVYDGAAIRANNGFFANPNNFLLGQGFLYGINFNVGANVAVGDVNNDGFADIVTAADIGNPHVKVFSGQLVSAGGVHNFDPNATDPALIAQGFPYALQFNVGANVAVADVEGNGFADIVTAANVGNPHVKVYSGKQLVANGPNNAFGPNDAGNLLLASFFPFQLSFNVGATVAFGDVDGDGVPDLIAGSTVGNPEVRIYRGAALRAGTFNSQNPDASLIDHFFAFEQSMNIGTTVGAADFDGDGLADILVGSINRGSPQYKVFKTNANFTHTTVLSGFQRTPPYTQGNFTVAVQNSQNSRF